MITARPVGPGDLEALFALFDAAASPCFCRYWHFEGDKNAWLARCAFEPETSRAELARAVGDGHDEGRGVVAEDGPALVGWAKIAPSRALSKLYGERYYRGLVQASRDGVWALGCLLVHPAHRRRQVSRHLVMAAVEVARAEGAQVVEAFPRRVACEVADEELWRGTATVLEGCGFVAVAGDEAYPVMRRTL
ncbi:MAG: GNAT family N-acetyltransferase [Polyangiaceae bacterium]|nr:GNAT family N-acetyltransferase [Polyangiaceae bacterium]